MKLLILCIALMLVKVNVNAQPGTIRYDTCQYLQQYTGEWRYVNGTDTIRIYLRLQRNFSTSLNYLSDHLLGWHDYKHGNVVVESNYQYRFMVLPYDADAPNPNKSIWLSLRECSLNYNQLKGEVTDYSQASERHDVTVTLDATKTIMTWHQQRSEGHLNSPYPGMMTLPGDFILIKQ